MCLKFENLRKIDWKSYFWEIWVQYKCFWKAFHLILMHSIHKILCFEEFLDLYKISLFFKNLIFPNFQSIELVVRQIEIAIKNLVWIYTFRLVLDLCWINRRHFRSIESNFRSIENRMQSSLKPWVFTWSFTIQTFSKLFLSLFYRSRLKAHFFVVFPPISSRVFDF